MPVPSSITAAADIAIIQVPDGENVVGVLSEKCAIGEIVLLGAGTFDYTVGDTVFMKDVEIFKSGDFTYALSNKANILFEYIQV